MEIYYALLCAICGDMRGSRASDGCQRYNVETGKIFYGYFIQVCVPYMYMICVQRQGLKVYQGHFVVSTTASTDSINYIERLLCLFDLTVDDKATG